MFPGIHEYYSIQVAEGDKVIKKTGKRRCHSFLKQFAQYMLFHNSLNGSMTMLDTSNTARSLTTPFNLATLADSGTVTYGLVLGSNGTAVTVSDYKLNTLIAHGTSSGQLQYSACVVGAPTWDATTNYFTFTRVFTNGSGGNVTVAEIGLYAIATYTYCMMRDVLASPITLANGQNLTLNYTITGTL